MRIWPRRTTVTPAVHLGLVVDPLQVDHRITHTYEARPKSQNVSLQFRDDHGFVIGQVIATYPGQPLEIPEWLTKQLLDRESTKLQILVVW